MTDQRHSQLDDLVHRADLDGLVRLVDESCAAGDWALLLRLRNVARTAVHSGRQLWPAATLAEFRLALWAPAEWAAQVLDEDSGLFTIGPLTEVVAQQHTFAELSVHVAGGPRLGFIAHERALRGEPIEPGAAPDVLEIPFALQSWEPAYPLATYSDEGVVADPPSLPSPDVGPAGRSPNRERVGGCEDPSVALAVRQLLEPWTTSSDGRVEVACAHGRAGDALGALGLSSARLTPLSPQEAMAWLAWTGAGGGAHGRRRGAALGRFGAWWTVVALADGLGDWPLSSDEVGEIATDLRWYWWDAGEPSLGWELQLAVEDPDEGVAWAISAHDAA